MKTAFTLLLLTLITFSAFSQKNFIPGHYITPQGEKVEALIKDQNWDRNPEFIEVSVNGSSRRLHVSSIKGFVLSSGDVFDAFIVDVDKSTTNLNAMKPGDMPVIVSDTVFLRAIVKGTASLYYLRDEHAKEHYYIRKGEEVPAELINRTIKVYNGTKIAVTKSPVYKSLLNGYLTECPEVADKAENLLYNRKSLINFVTEYNTCVSGSAGEYAATEEKVKIAVAPVAGLAYNKLGFNSSSGYEALTESGFSSVGITFGASILATLPRAKGRWSLQGELMYKNITVEDSNTDGDPSSESYTTTDIKFDMGLLTINAAIHYKLFDNQLKPFIKLGVGNSLVVTEDNAQTVYRKYYTMESTETKEPFKDLRKHEQALILGTGIEFGRFTTELNVEYGNGFSRFINLSNSRDSFILRVGYNLF